VWRNTVLPALEARAKLGVFDISAHGDHLLHCLQEAADEPQPLSKLAPSRSELDIVRSFAAALHLAVDGKAELDCLTDGRLTLQMKK
jgi:hypothetical protein